MIKINLATRKQSNAAITSSATGTIGATGTGFGSGTSTALNTLTNLKNTLTAFKFDLRLDSLRDVAIQRVLVIFVLCVVAWFSVDYLKSQQIKKVDAEIEKINAKNAELQAKLGKTKGFEAIKKILDGDEIMIRTKIDTVSKLIAGRQLSQKILILLANGVPKEVWLKELQLNEKGMQVSGAAVGFGEISDFMKNVQENAYFQNVRLVTTSQGKDENLATAALFELQADRRPGE